MANSINYVKVDDNWRHLANVYSKVDGEWYSTLPQPIYTSIYDKSKATTTSDCLTYSGACEGFTPMKGGTGNVNEGSWAQGNGTLFDAIEIGILADGQWVADDKSEMHAFVGYDSFTRIPRIYEKVTDLGNNKTQLEISLGQFNGSRLHPAFITDGVVKNHRYIGRFLGTISTTLHSWPTAAYPTTGLTRAEFRAAASANGAGYNLTKYWDWDLLNKLYLFAFKDFNSQSALGSGLTATDDMIPPGDVTSNGVSWMYGGGAGRQMCFLGIEDYYGNAWWFIDDFYCEGGTCYAGNVSTPTDDTNNKVAIATGLNYQGTPLTCKATLDAFHLMGTVGGTETTGLCDQQYYDTDANIGRVGGYYASGKETGMFYINAMNSASATSEMVGARLAYSD